MAGKCFKLKGEFWVQSHQHYLQVNLDYVLTFYDIPSRRPLYSSTTHSPGKVAHTCNNSFASGFSPVQRSWGWCHCQSHLISFPLIICDGDVDFVDIVEYVNRYKYKSWWTCFGHWTVNTEEQSPHRYLNNPPSPFSVAAALPAWFGITSFFNWNKYLFAIVLITSSLRQWLMVQSRDDRYREEVRSFYF